MRARASLFVLLGCAVVLTVAQVALSGMSWNDPAARAFESRPAALAQALIALEFAIVGGLIALRRPENAIGRLLVVGGFGLCVYSFAVEYSVRGVLTAPGSLPFAGVAAVLSQTAWSLPFAVLPVVMLLFPTGRPLSARWGLFRMSAALGSAVIGVGGTALLWPLRTRGRDLLLQAESLDRSGVPMDWVLTVGIALLLSSVIPAVASVVVRWRRSSRVERLQLRWLMPAGALVLLGSVPAGVLPSAWSSVALLAGLFAVPASVAVAVLRYRLYEIDRLITRVLAYAAVTGVLGVVYVVVAVLPSAVLNLDSNVLVAAATLAGAAVFVPVRRRVQTVVDRRFNRARYDAVRVVDGFRSKTRDQVDLDGLVSDLQIAVTLAVEPTITSVWIRGDS